MQVQFSVMDLHALKTKYWPQVTHTRGGFVSSARLLFSQSEQQCCSGQCPSYLLSAADRLHCLLGTAWCCQPSDSQAQQEEHASGWAMRVQLAPPSQGL